MVPKTTRKETFNTTQGVNKMFCPWSLLNNHCNLLPWHFGIFERRLNSYVVTLVWHSVLLSSAIASGDAPEGVCETDG